MGLLRTFQNVRTQETIISPVEIPTEAKLRKVLSAFGDILDVQINRFKYNQVC
jgi:hypothetical protein